MFARYNLRYKRLKAGLPGFIGKHSIAPQDRPTMSLTSQMSLSLHFLHGSLLQASFLFEVFTYHVNTLLLFTWNDYKTMFLPVVSRLQLLGIRMTHRALNGWQCIFAIVNTPNFTLSNIPHQWIWTWIHLLHFNVSNQSLSGHGDRQDKPWRPLPAGRISVPQARILRWALMPVCMLLSYYYSIGVCMASAVLSLSIFLYDDVLISAHPLGKNFGNLGGYAGFNAGAALILGRLSPH